jgi:hypothetical protein
MKGKDGGNLEDTLDMIISGITCREKRKQGTSSTKKK